MLTDLTPRGIALGTALAAFLAPAAFAQTVDELVAKNLQARGGIERIRAAETLRMKGRMTLEDGFEGAFLLEIKRPSRMRAELSFPAVTSVQAYDGNTAWVMMPMMGASEPQALPPDQAREAAEQADIDGPLVDWKANGHRIVLAGRETRGGRELYKLEVSLRAGGVRVLYLDATSYLEVRGEGRRSLVGREVVFENVFSDFRDVGGLMMPHVIEGGPKGEARRQRITFEKIEVNVPLDDARFAMPRSIP